MMSQRFRMSSTFLLDVPAEYRPFLSFLVSTILMSSFSNSFFSFNAIERLMSFSFASLIPIFPGSSPPCPASIAMQISFSSALPLLTRTLPFLARKKADVSRMTAITSSIFFFIKNPECLLNLNYSYNGYFMRFTFPL